jgi:putative salt-induced outer membrane protein YdiY
MLGRSTCVCVLSLFLWLLAAPCQAQDVNAEPPAEPPATEPPPSSPWEASISAGLALSSGNSNTSTYNLAFDAIRDDQHRFVFRTSGLLLRGEQEDELNIDRRVFETRADLRLNEKVSMFGQGSYLRDRFKGINYLASPTLGLSLRPSDGGRVELYVDGSLGAVFEKNGARARTSGALRAGQRLAVGLNDAARIMQQVSALWKVEDLGDALYTFTAGLAASVTKRSELKAEVLDTYKSEPADETRRNDLVVLVSIVYKF